MGGPLDGKVATRMSVRLARYLGPAAIALLLTSSAGAQTYQVLHGFGPSSHAPEGALLADGSGNLYGTTWGGGVYGLGTVFKLDGANGYALTTLHEFRPDGLRRPRSPSRRGGHRR